MKIRYPKLLTPVNIGLMGASLGLTLFIGVNSYELAFNKDLNRVQALEPVIINRILPSNVYEVINNTPSAAYEGGFGAPIYLKLPSESIRLPIAQAIYDPLKGWLGRSNAAHYVITQPSRNNNLGTTIIYVRKSWRTIDNPNAIQPGSNLFLDTNRDWRYMYRVTEVTTYSYDDPYVIEDGRVSKLVVIVQDGNSKLNHVISSDMVNIQNIQL